MKGLILIYAIAVIGSIAALRSPRTGLLVYIGFAVLRPQGIFGWAGNMDGISRMVGVATLLGWAFNGFGSSRVPKARSVVAALLMFLLWSLLSAVQAADSDLAYGAVVELLKIVMPFMVGITVLDSQADARKMLWTIVVAAAYVSFELNLSYYRGYNMAAEGFAGMDNNCLGVSLVTVIGPAIALALASKTWKERILAGTSVVLIIHATLLTFSRGAMVGMLAVGFTAFVILPKRPRYVAALVLVALLAWRLTGPQLMARYQSAFLSAEEGGDQGEGRVDLWLDCLSVLKSRPLFGVGPWNWRLVASSFGWTEGKSAHSVWMETAAETGAPGVLALLWFFAWGALKLWPLARAKPTPENRYEMAAATGIILGIVGFATSGQFVSLAGLETPYYITMVGVVMLNAGAQQAAKVAAVAERAQPPLRNGPRLAPAPVRHGFARR